ncbi:MAG: alpha/beta fold hydrolase [Sphingobium sp.]|nr:alpha/beta fold hydrolase [Sphingobium sp.]
MSRFHLLPRLLFLLALALISAPATALPEPASGLYIAHDFRFASGETLKEMKLAYTTLGTPHRNAKGEIDNAVMFIHGTGGTGRQFLAQPFGDALFGPGKPLDAARFFVILPDAIGHGGSSKPSDGLRMAFPRYDYADMVEAHYRLLAEHLGVHHLKIILGYSMGGMGTFQWATTRPDFADTYVPLGCYPVEVAGQNRMQRKLQIDAIKGDPAWAGGNYRTQPVAGLRNAMGVALLFSGSALDRQTQAPTRETADNLLEVSINSMIQGRDANDVIYQVDASRTYNPWPLLDRIKAPLLWVNAADDQVNPVSIDVTPAALKRMPTAQFLLILAGKDTRGHGTLMQAQYWADRLGQFLAPVAPATAP